MDYFNIFLKYTQRMLRKYKSDAFHKVILDSNKLIFLARTQEDDFPAVIISDLEEFQHLFMIYIQCYMSMESIYTETTVAKHLRFFLKDATREDLVDLNLYLKKRLSFLQDNSFCQFDSSTYLGDFMNHSVFVKRSEAYHGFETPYELNFFSLCNDMIYPFPTIRYGIFEDKIYVYAVQNVELNNEQMDFYRSFKDIDSYLSGMKRKGSFPPSFLISLLLFFCLSLQEGFQDIVFIDFLPFRYRSFSYHYDEEIVNRTQWKITNQLWRTIVRLSMECGNIKIISYPDLDGMMRIKINDKVASISNPRMKELFLLGHQKLILRRKK